MAAPDHITSTQVAAWLEYQGDLALESLPFLAAGQAFASPSAVAPPIAAPAVVAPLAAALDVPAYTRPTLVVPPPAMQAPVAERAPAPPSCAAAPPRGAFSLQVVREDLGECTRCKLHKSRQNIVFGVGNPTARIVFVGEGPGADEDRLGEPFVGKAGQLLTKMIEAMGLQRSDVYICNVVKCRPPNNRDPEPDEVAACSPFLQRQLEGIRPEVIITLGKHAAHNLLGDKTPITRLRGQWRVYQGVPVMPTYHPAYLLRSPHEKRFAWQDLQTVMGKLGLTPPTRGPSA